MHGEIRLIMRVFEVCMNACMDRLEEEVKCPSGFGG
jgi:hypothetical protein